MTTLKAGEGLRALAKPTAPDSEFRLDQLTADALAALAKLDAHGNAGLPLLLQFGEALSNAKADLKHGAFNPWCRDVLKRSASWCSAHRRLYEDRADLEPALAWAAETNHKWVSCRSVERLLKIIADYRAATHRDSATVRRARRGAKPMTLRAAKRRIAELHRLLNEARADIIALRDPLPADVEARAAELAAADDDAAKDELAALARRYHWRPGDFVAETCSALKVSRPASDEASDADESTSDERSAS
ncbi:hypothetical protein [Roseiarcus sp.]|uniref:hypothetical protein n=1 Tax=Roseiarcus sp. TaxID=1969460 RepID=UPI003F9CE441